MSNDVHLTYKDVHLDVIQRQSRAKIYQALPPFSSGGSKVIRKINIAEKGEPGDEASNFQQVCMNAHNHAYTCVYCCLATRAFIGLLQETGWVWLTAR